MCFGVSARAARSEGFSGPKVAAVFSLGLTEQFPGWTNAHAASALREAAAAKQRAIAQINSNLANTSSSSSTGGNSNSNTANSSSSSSSADNDAAEADENHNAGDEHHNADDEHQQSSEMQINLAVNRWSEKGKGGKGPYTDQAGAVFITLSVAGRTDAPDLRLNGPLAQLPRDDFASGRNRFTPRDVASGLALIAHIRPTDTVWVPHIGRGTVARTIACRHVAKQLIVSHPDQAALDQLATLIAADVRVAVGDRPADSPKPTIVPLVVSRTASDRGAPWAAPEIEANSVDVIIADLSIETAAERDSADAASVRALMKEIRRVSRISGTRVILISRMRTPIFQMTQNPADGIGWGAKRSPVIVLGVDKRQSTLFEFVTKSAPWTAPGASGQKRQILHGEKQGTDKNKNSRKNNKNNKNKNNSKDRQEGDDENNDAGDGGDAEGQGNAEGQGSGQQGSDEQGSGKVDMDVTADKSDAQAKRPRESDDSAPVAAASAAGADAAESEEPTAKRAKESGAEEPGADADATS
jgi:hypothetical protein